LSKCLVLFSGGIDSTAMLKHLLESTKDELVVHHISMRTLEDHWMAEDEAAVKIIEYLRAIRYFDYSMSVIDIGRVRSWLDWELLGFMGALQAREYQCDTIAVGRKKDGKTFATSPKIFGAQHEFMQGMSESLARTNLFLMKGNVVARWDYPLWDWSSRRVVEYLGPELRALTISCRRPTRTESGWQPCGQCNQCKMYAELEAQ